MITGCSRRPLEAFGESCERAVTSLAGCAARLDIFLALCGAEIVTNAAAESLRRRARRGADDRLGVPRGLAPAFCGWNRQAWAWKPTSGSRTAWWDHAPTEDIGLAALAGPLSTVVFDCQNLGVSAVPTCLAKRLPSLVLPERMNGLP